jgi:hypothetical protein
MDRKDFVKNYVQPSTDALNRAFTLPLPEIAGLERCGEFIVQGRLEGTCSTNVITKFENADRGVRIIEVYKNTEDHTRGIFVRLVGSISLCIRGYPFAFVDGVVSNVSPLTTQREDLTTRVAVHFPQADTNKRTVLFEFLNEQADNMGTSSEQREPEVMPDFWGPFWIVSSSGLDLNLITKLREFVWTGYEQYCNQTEADPDFDYSPMQHHIISKHSKAEHQLFKKMGLSVSTEAQAAFFSVLVGGA